MAKRTAMPQEEHPPQGGNLPQGRHIPQRTCIGCRQTKPKRDLARIVRTPEGGVTIDTAGKAEGRGAYVCVDAGCARRALRAGALKRALRTGIDAAALAELQAWAESLAEPAHAPPNTA